MAPIFRSVGIKTYPKLSLFPVTYEDYMHHPTTSYQEPLNPDKRHHSLATYETQLLNPPHIYQIAIEEANRETGCPRCS